MIALAKALIHAALSSLAESESPTIMALASRKGSPARAYFLVGRLPQALPMIEPYATFTGSDGCVRLLAFQYRGPMCG